MVGAMDRLSWPDYADPRDAQVAKGLTLDEARRTASNIGKSSKTSYKELRLHFGVSVWRIRPHPCTKRMRTNLFKGALVSDAARASF